MKLLSFDFKLTCRLVPYKISRMFWASAASLEHRWQTQDFKDKALTGIHSFWFFKWIYYFIFILHVLKQWVSYPFLSFPTSFALFGHLCFLFSLKRGLPGSLSVIKAVSSIPLALTPKSAHSNPDFWAHTQSFWFSKSGIGTHNLHF